MYDWPGWLIYDYATFWDTGGSDGCAGCAPGGGGGGSWGEWWYAIIPFFRFIQGG